MTGGSTVNRVFIATLAFILMLSLAACTATESQTGSDGAQEATVIEDGVRITLYENQALPYRWSLTIESEVLYLDADETIDSYDFPLAAGDARANRVFTLRFSGDGIARVMLSCSRIEPEDPDDAIDQRTYLIEKSGDSIALIPETGRN